MIKLEDKKIDDLYHMTFTGKGMEVEICDYDVMLPDVPPDEEIENYGLPLKEQKYKRLEVPKAYHGWEYIRQESYASKIWHIRRNGRWHFIKGQKIYITGQAEIFFSFWMMEGKRLPDCRQEAWEYFQWWLAEVELDDNCFGACGIKGRRIGDTEKALFLLWERTTRERTHKSTMQNITESDAQDNFKRLIECHHKMIKMLKPVHEGKEKPKTRIEFRFPTGTNSLKSLREKKSGLLEVSEANGPEELGSMIDYLATVYKAGDGKKFNTFHLDEFGKIDGMNSYEQWDVIKKCLSLYNGKIIVGKAILTSTVEELKNSDTVEIAQKLWDNSDPEDLDSQGRTTTGLKRIFRSALLSAQPDEYGFIDKEKEEKRILGEMEELRRKKLFDELSRYRRKQPLTIEDSLQPPGEDCVLLPDLLDDQSSFIRLQKPEIVRGKLKWKDGVRFGKVVFEPNKKGDWYIHRHPEVPNHVEEIAGIPLNSDVYNMGMDPYQYNLDEKMGIKNQGNNSKVSKMAIVIHRTFDPSIDSPDRIRYEEDTEGDDKYSVAMNANEMLTDKFVAYFLGRPPDPDDMFWEMMKACYYYGCKCFMEKNKSTVFSLVAQYRKTKFIATRPSESYNSDVKGRKAEFGAPSSTQFIELYTDRLRSHVAGRSNGIMFMEIVKQFRKFTGKNQTKLDLVVAAGFALVQDMKKRRTLVRSEQSKKFLKKSKTLGASIFKRRERIM